MQCLETVQSQVKVGYCVAAKAIYRATAQEPDPPAPHMRHGSRAQQKRRVLAAEPSEDLARHAWLGPGLNLAGMNNTAVAETGFERRARPTLHNRDVVPALVQEIGGRNPDDSSSDDDRFHKCIRVMSGSSSTLGTCTTTARACHS